ncbi:oligopeptidase B, partial [Ornithobacterium rhinotracheale]
VKIYDEGIQNTSGSSVWANDNQTIFYTENNTETLLSEKIKRHQLGTQASEDVCVYHEQDPTNYIGVYKSKNRDYIL